jgi:hypothetical protein
MPRRFNYCLASLGVLAVQYCLCFSPDLGGSIIALRLLASWQFNIVFASLPTLAVQIFLDLLGG